MSALDHLHRHHCQADGKALEKHPLLNARWNDDKIVISRHPHRHRGRHRSGLLVPVIRDVPGQSFASLPPVRAISSFVPEGSLMAAEMQGGTFTVTNLGAMGIEMFTPLINLPECAILGLGRIQKQVVVDDRQFVGTGTHDAVS